MTPPTLQGNGSGQPAAPSWPTGGAHPQGLTPATPSLNAPGSAAPLSAIPATGSTVTQVHTDPARTADGGTTRTSLAAPALPIEEPPAMPQMPPAVEELPPSPPTAPTGMSQPEPQPLEPAQLPVKYRP
jgi:hypothetical protein